MKTIELYALVGLGVLGALWYAKGAVGGAVAAAVPYIDPTSDQNVAYQGATKITQAMTGDTNATLGTWLYDLTH